MLASTDHTMFLTGKERRQLTVWIYYIEELDRKLGQERGGGSSLVPLFGGRGGGTLVPLFDGRGHWYMLCSLQWLCLQCMSKCVSLALTLYCIEILDHIYRATVILMSIQTTVWHVDWWAGELSCGVSLTTLQLSLVPRLEETADCVNILYWRTW